MRRKPQRSPVSDPRSGPAVPGTTRSHRTHDQRGKFVTANGLGGRPKGAKDQLFSRNGVGSLKKVYDDFVNCRGGHAKMLKVLEAGIKAPPAVAIKFLELGAKVLDRTEESAGRVVHFHIHTNVNPFALCKAGEKHGLIGRPALPPKETVGETVRSLQQAGVQAVLIHRLVQALRHRTGCSRASAYRAVEDAFKAGAIGWS